MKNNNALMITLNYDDYICVKLAFSETEMLSIIQLPLENLTIKCVVITPTTATQMSSSTETSYLPRA